MNITLKDIRPDGTGKYSDRFYRWCRKEMKNPRFEPEHPLPHVFLVGDYDPISVAKYSNYSDRNHTVWIGQRDKYQPQWLYGFWAAPIANPITTLGRFNNSAILSGKIEEVTEWFWRHYLDMGTCFIVGDLKHDWIQINRNSRKCRHCLKHERRIVETIRMTKRVERWSDEEVPL